MNGVHMNPQTVRLPGAEPLQADALARFLAAAVPLLGRLSGPPAAGTDPSVASTGDGAMGAKSGEWQPKTSSN